MGETADGDSGELGRLFSAAEHDGDAVARGSADDDGLEALLTRRLPRRRRILQLASVLVVLGVVVGLLANSLVPLRSLPALFGPPTGTPDPSLISTVLVYSSVTWGTLTLNGKVVAGSLPRHVTLRPGDNALTFTAPPFLPRACHVTAPIHWNSERIGTSGACSMGFAWGDGCPATAAPGECVTGSFRQVHIEMGLSADDLPADLRHSAVAYLRQTLGTLASFTTSVPRGQYFATGIDASNRTILRQPAPEVLTAELTATADVRDSADTPPVSISSYGDASQCATLNCFKPIISDDPTQPPPSWSLLIPEVLTWRFTSATGALIGSVAIIEPDSLNIYLAYDNQTGWRLVGPSPTIAGSVPASLCEAGAQLLSGMQPYGMLLSAIHIEGCALRLQAHDGTNPGLVIWRFGVLLAADSATQNLLPSLPLAPPDEIKAVSP